MIITLPNTNIAPTKRLSPNKKLIFQPPVFQVLCYSTIVYIMYFALFFCAMGFINMEHTIWYRKYVLGTSFNWCQIKFNPPPPQKFIWPVQPSSTSMTTGKQNILIYQHVNNPSWNSFVLFSKLAFGSIPLGCFNLGWQKFWWFLWVVPKFPLESPLALESHTLPARLHLDTPGCSARCFANRPYSVRVPIESYCIYGIYSVPCGGAGSWNPIEFCWFACFWGLCFGCWLCFLIRDDLNINSSMGRRNLLDFGFWNMFVG